MVLKGIVSGAAALARAPPTSGPPVRSAASPARLQKLLVGVAAVASRGKCFSTKSVFASGDSLSNPGRFLLKYKPLASGDIARKLGSCRRAGRSRGILLLEASEFFLWA